MAGRAGHGRLRRPVVAQEDRPTHEILDRAGITARFAGIGTDGLTGSAVFTDGQVEDAERLCVELAVAAQATAR